MEVGQDIEPKLTANEVIRRSLEVGVVTVASEVAEPVIANTIFVEDANGSNRRVDFVK